MIAFNDPKSNGFEIEPYSNDTVRPVTSNDTVRPVTSVKMNARCAKLLFSAIFEAGAGSWLNP
jgi:hypothetical protein